MIPHSQPWLLPADHQMIESVLAVGMIARGQRVRQFEQTFGDYLGIQPGIAVGSGTSALLLALKALGIGHGDEVILPTYVCHQVADAVVHCGAAPVLCDVGPYWNMTPATVEPRLSARTRAIIVVHILGIPADTRTFYPFGLPILEDCCQALGARIDGQVAGNLGTFGVYSFQATKCLTTGEGGMVTAADPEQAAALRKIGAELVLLSPLSDLQAALGLSQLARYEEALLIRRRLAERYFQTLPNQVLEKVQAVREQSMFFRFPVTIEPGSFEVVQQRFAEAGIAVRRGVDALLHRNAGLPDAEFPNAAALFDTTLSLPIYPALADDEQTHIIETCNRLWKSA